MLHVTQANWKVDPMISPYLYVDVFIWTYFSSSIKLYNVVVDPNVDLLTGEYNGTIKKTQFLM
jgi:hypothetical protein